MKMRRVDYPHRLDPVSIQKLDDLCLEFIGDGSPGNGRFAEAFGNVESLDYPYPFDEFVILSANADGTMFTFSFREADQNIICLQDVVNMLRINISGAPTWHPLPEEEGTRFDFINLVVGWRVLLNATNLKVSELKTLGNLDAVLLVMEEFAQKLRGILSNPECHVPNMFVKDFPPPRDINIPNPPSVITQEELL